MRSATSHRVLDRVNAAQDRRIASAIRRDPRVLRVARDDLRRWMAADGKRVRPVFRDWHAVLHRLTAREIAAFLCKRHADGAASPAVESPGRNSRGHRTPGNPQAV